jgi:hypothetical protein
MANLLGLESGCGHEPPATGIFAKEYALSGLCECCQRQSFRPRPDWPDWPNCTVYNGAGAAVQLNCLDPDWEDVYEAIRIADELLDDEIDL